MMATRADIFKLPSPPPLRCCDPELRNFFKSNFTAHTERISRSLWLESLVTKAASCPVLEPCLYRSISFYLPPNIDKLAACVSLHPRNALWIIIIISHKYFPRGSGLILFLLHPVVATYCHYFLCCGVRVAFTFRIWFIRHSRGNFIAVSTKQMRQRRRH